MIIASVIFTQENIEAKEIETKLFPTAVGLKGQVTTSKVNMRTGPELSAEVISQQSNSEIMVIGRHKDWYRVRRDEAEGWMSSQYIRVSNADYIPEVTMVGEQIVSYGKKFIGTPYVWGGTSLSGGVDCSGFTQGIYKEFDININRTSNMQALNGKPISKNELKSGDLIFFDTNGVNRGRISHVGVYAGNGEFIHSNSSKGISLAKLDNSYYKKNYVKSVRVPGI